MAPKVYGITGSPPFTAVLICAKVLGIELDIEQVDLINGAHFKEDYIKKNPQHTVPLLEDDGFLLADSHAINGYLVGTYGKENDSLYPKNDIKRRATIDHRLHLDSSIVAAKGFLITRPLILNNIKPSEETIEGLKETFVILDRQIATQNTSYIAGNVLSIADFSVTTTVTNWGFFLKNWENEFPNIKSYIDRMKQERWYHTNEECVKAFHGIMGLRLKQFEK